MGVDSRTLRRCADLAGFEDPNLVAQAVMTNLGLVDQSGEWPTPLERSQPLRMRGLALAIPVDMQTTSGMVPGHLAVKLLGAFPRQQSTWRPRQPDQVAADPPEPRGDGQVAGGLVGDLGLAVCKELASDPLHVG